MKILAIESSCDETAAAVVEDGRRALSNVVASQVEEHRLYGGVVPEIASRRHAEAISGVVRQALEDAETSLGEIGAVAVTCAPGLIGALLVGVNFAKGLSLSSGKPLIPVHHLRSHIAANYLSLSGGVGRTQPYRAGGGLHPLHRPRPYPGRRGGGMLRQGRAGDGDALPRRGGAGPAGREGEPRRLPAPSSTGGKP